MSPILYCSIVIVNYSFTGISGCLEFELEVSLVAWIRLGGCCLVYSPILRSRRSQILGFRSLDYQILEDTRLAILLVKYRSLSYLDYTPLGAQKSCSVYTPDAALCPIMDWFNSMFNSLLLNITRLIGQPLRPLY